MPRSDDAQAASGDGHPAGAGTGVALAVPLRAGLRFPVPGDKSVSHRALLLGAMAEGTTRIRGLLDAEDVGRTAVAVAQVGARVERRGGDVFVTGGAWRDAGRIECGNSGTTARLLLGALAPRAGATLVGDPSLSRRPMQRVLGPLAAMGARCEGGVTLPITVVAAPLRGGHFRAQVASAQVKSAVLLAGLAADGETSWTEPTPTRDHTERMLRGMGAPLQCVGADGGTRLTVSRATLYAADIVVPGDISSAAFWFVAAAVAGVSLTIEGVGVNPTRTGVLEVLRRMGADVQIEPLGGIEPIANVTVSAAGLRGVEIGGGEVPTLIDELPILAIAAAFAEGDTVVRDAAELRVKESDRVAAVVAGLRAMGVAADAGPDGFVVRGGRGQAGGTALIETHGDHRIAMAFSIAGLFRRVALSETASIDTSYPGFLERLTWVTGASG
ncbi:MAG: 3-phosphoshikimate 1-carboxyvinyltransferase [Myxococcales bacterium]|nr:3-phosphoshikimate 1-carboxyvinyltransferase [Myxococcales bacterium]